MLTYPYGARGQILVFSYIVYVRTEDFAYAHISYWPAHDIMILDHTDIHSAKIWFKHVPMSRLLCTNSEGSCKTVGVQILSSLRWSTMQKVPKLKVLTM